MMQKNSLCIQLNIFVSNKFTRKYDLFDHYSDEPESARTSIWVFTKVGGRNDITDEHNVGSNDRVNNRRI